MKKKIISILLTAAMLFTAKGIPAMAGSVTGGNEAERTGAARETPQNPVHTCTKENDGTDATKWSYVYFGSYPQTEVTGDALTAAITGASYDANGDAWINGTKYRRMKKSDANYSSTDSGYFQWNGDNDYHYFKWERIKWRVLENNGSTLFVVADQGLDCKDYNETYTSITWENCTLRTWLNGTFYNTAFSSSEQGAIVQQTVVNYGTAGGNDTQDNVYLLSVAEVTNPECGFCEDYSVYSASRWMQPSEYAHAMGANTYSSSITGGNANCRWWLRSPGSRTSNAADVHFNGSVYRSGFPVYDTSDAVTPALQINLSSDLWSTVDDGTNGEGGGSGTGSGSEDFSIDASANGTLGKSITVIGTLTLSDDAQTSSEILSQSVSSITWTSSNPSVAEVTNCSGVNAMDYKSAGLIITVTPYRTGTVTITGKTAGGSTASCVVTVTEGEEEGEITLRHITGELESVDLNLLTVTIDHTVYEVTDSFSISDAYTILSNSSCKTVAAVLSNGRISNMAAVTDLVEPKVSIAIRPGSISYQNGAFDQEKMTAAVTLSCGAKSPFRDSDLKGTEAENVSVSFSGFTVTAENGLEFRTSLLSKSQEYTDKTSVSLKFGQEKTAEQTLYTAKSYVPQQVKDTLRITVSASAGGKRADHMTSLYVANMDKQAEIADSKSSDALILEAEELLKKVTFSLGDYPMEQAGYTKKQKEAVNAAVKVWLTEVLMTQILTQDTGDNSIWSEFCNSAGFSDSQKQKFLTNIAKKAFKKVGLDISGITNSGSMIQWNNMAADTIIQMYQEDGKTYDTIRVNLNCGSMSFTGSQAFTATGNIEYSIETAAGKTYDDLNVGMVTFADLQQFSEGMEKICQSEIQKIYNMEIGSNLDKGAEWIRNKINKSTESVLAEILTSDTASKILEKQYGSVSDNVYKIYTKELAKTTKGSVHCPVDVSIYDSQGTLCGSIVDNEVETDNGEIFLYCIGDEKFFYLTGDDYQIRLSGNDTGTMTYQIGEYLGGELIREIRYENVPLSDSILYTGRIPETQLLDSEVYNLVSDEDAETILPDSDIVHDNTRPEEKPDPDQGGKKPDPNQGGAKPNLNAGISNPKATSLQGKIKAKSKAFLVKWKKQTDITGYQIQYSANKKFKKKGTKIKTVKNPQATKLTVKKLKPGKKYYVRIRTYKTANGATLYSGWSKAKTVKIKK